MYKPLSELAVINPSCEIPRGFSVLTPVSFIPMSDVNESGHWFYHQIRSLGSVLNGFTSFVEGDVLVAKITPCMENGKGTLAKGLENGIGFGSTEFHVLRARSGTSSRFLFHISQSKKFRTIAETFMIGSAGQQRVQRQFFDAYLVPNLSFDEQEQIADILDTLDTTIRQTEAIIAKLQQVKQGLLHDLLTRGIDANGQLRPPVEQAPHLYKKSPLGWIPREWEILAFGALCESSAFGPRFPADAYDPEGSLAVLRTTDIDNEGNITLDTMPRAALSLVAMKNHLLQNSDLLISRSGTCGIATVFSGYWLDVIPGAFLIRFRLLTLGLSKFYRRYFNSTLGRPRLEKLAIGGVQKNIKGSDVLRLPVPVPPLDEAKGMVEIVEAHERMEIKTRQELQKLRQNKSALMDDLLTGRVRVTTLLSGEISASEKIERQSA